MVFNAHTFLTHIKSIVTGGGRDSNGTPVNDSGFLRSVSIPLSSVEPGTNVALAADETNARVLKVTLANDTVFHGVAPVPSDYDEATDDLFVRVLASQATQSVDTDVELDSEFYVKTAGSALSADKDPTAPGTILSTTEQWIEFDLSQNGITRDDTLTFKLITNGANDSLSEEVLIHAVEIRYRSTFVSYDEFDASSNGLR